VILEEEGGGWLGPSRVVLPFGRDEYKKEVTLVDGRGEGGGRGRMEGGRREEGRREGSTRSTA
jgi:hypothetical protein